MYLNLENINSSHVEGASIFIHARNDAGPENFTRTIALIHPSTSSHLTVS